MYTSINPLKSFDSSLPGKVILSITPSMSAGLGTNISLWFTLKGSSVAASLNIHG